MTELYLPANASEGQAFMERWCDRCARDSNFCDDSDGAEGCSILAAIMAGEEVPEWQLIDGEPRCLAFEAMHDDDGMICDDRQTSLWADPHG